MTDKITIEPIRIPAVAEKIYSKLWVTDFSWNGNDPSNTNLYAILRPATENNEILVQSGTEKVVQLSDVMGIMMGTKIEPKLSPETIQKAGQTMAMVIDFLNSVIVDKSQPDEIIQEVVTEEPIFEEVVNEESN